MIALSTAYFKELPDSSGGKAVGALISQIKKLGFEALELGLNVPAKLVKPLASNFKILSIHNFCPMLETVPPGRTIYSPYSIASTDEKERKLAVDLTWKTVELAASLGVRVVVIHAGHVELELPAGGFFKPGSPAKYASTLARYRNELRSGARYSRILHSFLEERNRKAPYHIDSVLKSISELETRGLGNGVKLGLENRFWAHEIPSFEEIGIILKNFSENVIGYWHDVGHGIVAERLGLVRFSTDFLKTYSHRLTGVHLHDCLDVFDHRAPGTGDVDFGQLVRYLSPDTILVNETHHTATEMEMRASRLYLDSYGIH